MVAVKSIAIVVISFLLFSFVFSYLQAFIMSTVTQRLSKRLRSRIVAKINKLPLSYVDSTANGDVLSRITNDVDTIGQSLGESLTTLVASIVQIIGALILMIITNWAMALTAVFASVIGFVLIGIIMKHSQKFFRLQQTGLGEVNGHIEEIYSAHTTITVTNAQKEQKRKFDKLNQNLFKSNWKAHFLGGLMGPAMGFIGNFGYVAVCIVGALLTINGNISFGVIVAFILYVRLFSSPLSQIAQVASSVQTAAAAGERVFEFLEAKELNDESNRKLIDNISGDVVFSHVCFGYLPEKEIIHDFSASVKAGQKVAIVGPTGAGKTTLVNLLMRFYDINGGEITIGGVNINDIPRYQIHQMFGMVLQDTWVFDGTIKEMLPIILIT